MDSRFRGNDGIESSELTQTSKSKTRSVAAIGNGCVIPACFGHRAGIQLLPVT